jgi:hypothetical protein
MKQTIYNWHQTDTTLALKRQNHVVWQFNFSKTEGRPYFYPVCLLDGTELTSLRPADHLHQRSLYFSWKYINNINYYDPDQPPGETKIHKVHIERCDDFSAEIGLELAYHPTNRPVVLTEKRALFISAPVENGSYFIDWDCLFTARGTEVELNRTPISGQEDGKWWGGYAGLILRMRPDYKAWQALNDNGNIDGDTHGRKARWLDTTILTPGDVIGGVTLLDHSQNPRHPNEWLLHENDMTKHPGRYLYITSGFIYSEPYTIKPAGQLRLKYRTIIHPGKPYPDFIAANWKAFCN